MERVQPIKIFFCSARKDKDLLDELKCHLEPLRRLGKIKTWDERNVQPGIEWSHEIETHLKSSDIILLLISPAFMQSDGCYETMQKALQIHKAKEARVIPIILRPVEWRMTPLDALQALPPEGKPVTAWQRRGDAFCEVVKGINEVVDQLQLAQGLSPARLRAHYQELASMLCRVTRYREIVPPDPDTASLCEAKARIFLQLGCYEDALLECKEAMRLFPDDRVCGLMSKITAEMREKYGKEWPTYLLLQEKFEEPFCGFFQHDDNADLKR